LNALYEVLFQPNQTKFRKINNNISRRDYLDMRDYLFTGRIKALIG